EVIHVERERSGSRGAFVSTLIQIILLDIVFSLDSVITAVGMANRLSVMVTAMVLAMLVMLWAAGPISSFVERRPSVKILALAFLLLIGVMLVAEGMGSHIEKGYIYFAMAFSLFVEMLNLRYRNGGQPVSLPHRFEDAEGTHTRPPPLRTPTRPGGTSWPAPSAASSSGTTSRSTAIWRPSSASSSFLPAIPSPRCWRPSG